MISRVSSFAQTSAMTAASLKIQARLADQQTQTASGLKSQTYGGIGNIDATQRFSVVRAGVNYKF